MLNLGQDTWRLGHSAGHPIGTGLSFRLIIRHAQVWATKQNRPPTGYLPLEWSASIAHELPLLCVA